nr:uncharacterized protein LOC111503174 [Leptinotarsa decemlineata]XP_023013179.1 uncharacterized protein LOC111503174 [Leptinotarsa decemlineata]
MSTKKREGDIGKCYEREILTLIALKCLLKSEIADFWLCTNHFNIDKFDDLILHVEYRDERREIFFMQLKHKQKGDKLIVVEMFKRQQKDFSLKTFEEAYKSIMKNKEFFSSNNISENTKMFFILYNNCKVEMTCEDPSKLCFKLIEKEDFRSFISSNAFEEISTEYVINNSDICSEFLSQFYFYAGQLHSKDVPIEIERFTGMNRDFVTNMLKYFYDFADSKNPIEKISKVDVKTKLLGYIFGVFVPPTNHSKNYSLLAIIKNFDAILIYEEYSEIAVWSDIIIYMREYYKEETLTLENWEKPLPVNLQEKFRERFNLIKEVEMNTKHLYFHLVAQRILPFYIETRNEFFKPFFKKMIHKLDIITVIIDSQKFFFHNPEFDSIKKTCNLKFLENIDDMNKEEYLNVTTRIKVSLQGKQYFPLSSVIINDENLRKTISVDLLISLLDGDIKFGSKRAEDPLYIGRKLKIPVLSEKILENKECLFIVCGISSLNNSKPLIRYLNSIRLGVDDMEELDYDRAFPILTSLKNFDRLVMKALKKIPRVGLYCILQFVYKTHDLKNRFIVKDTNVTSDDFKDSVCENEFYQLDDSELFESNKNSKINIICNNAGMGKTAFLNHISNLFSPTEWVVQLELGRFSNDIKKLVDFNGFVEFIRKIEMKTVDESYRSIFKLLYQYSIDHRKIVILIDDYEEINERKILKILKIATEKRWRIWIVGRPQLKMELEANFGVWSLELNEFTVNDQDKFFRKFFGEDNESEEVEKKMSLVAKTRERLENSFIGICQQTMMLAEVVNFNEKITENYIRVEYLYEKFITLQIVQHYSKNHEFIFNILSKLALYSFFSKKCMKKLVDWDEFDSQIKVFEEMHKKTAIVTQIQNDNFPLFSHKTYAEFLAAKWLADTVTKQIKKETPFDVKEILKLLYCPELTNVRLFFDKILTKYNQPHSSIFNNVAQIDVILREGNETDILGRTIYHILLSYGKRFHIYSGSEMKQKLQNYDELVAIERKNELILLKVPDLAEESKLNSIRKSALSSCSSSQLIKTDLFLGKNPLDYAIMSGSLEELEVALDNLTSRRFFSTINRDCIYFILFHSIKNNFNKIFSTINLQNIQDSLIQIREHQTGMSLLHLAVKYKNLKAVKQLIKAVSEIGSWGVDREQNTPLHLACPKENLPVRYIFHRLGKYSATFFNLKNARGWSHLHSFVNQGYRVWVENILKHPGIEVDSCCSQGNTPFILSVLKRNLGMAELLKNNGANINIGNINKMTALHFAASKGSNKFAEKLLEWGAELEVRTTYGATPLIKASSWGRVKIVELLLRKGADINATDHNKWTSLHHAIKRKKIEVIQVLVQYRANVNAVTDNENTPLIIACIHNVPQAIKLLTESDIPISLYNYSKSEKGRALNIARRKKHEECVLLIEELRKRGKTYLRVRFC